MVKPMTRPATSFLVRKVGRDNAVICAPRDWLKDNHINIGDRVYMTIDEGGRLIVEPVPKEAQA